LKSIKEEIEKKRMNVFNIRSVGDCLRLGQLKGNHFEIIIRHLRNQLNDSANLTERILEAIENVKVRKPSSEIVFLKYSILRETVCANPQQKGRRHVCGLKSNSYFKMILSHSPH
jgi:hypothetical protein